MYACLCKGITDAQIRTAVNDGADTVRALTKTLGAATQCGKCACYIRDLVQSTVGASENSSSQFYRVS